MKTYYGGHGGNPAAHFSKGSFVTKTIGHPGPTGDLEREIHPKTEIQWKGALLENASWENLWRFTKTYPQFSLADNDIQRRMD